jgi:cephalosporin hydroxylase
MDHFFPNVEGYFTFPHLYSWMVKYYQNGAHFVEIGSWYGKSSVFMAVEIANSGKNIKFDCVDTWLGSAEHANHENVRKGLVYDIFLRNIEPVKHIINPIRMTSLEAANLYADNSLDFVFIDADHSYEGVISDIKAWFPKVKVGGHIAGHDYNEIDWPGVVKAVDEFFTGKFIIISREEGIWCHYKP